jgi:HEAT repeat protein
MGESALLAFLDERITDPKPPPVDPDSAIRAAVARLQSADAADRKAAAQTLLDLAPQRLEYMINVTAYLFNDVIRRPAHVNRDAWRDAALILGRLRHASTAGLTLYLERDGAPAALMELGEPAVPAVTDVLKIGGPARRRLAATVLGAIGGPTARGALNDALKRDPDANVKKAIQTALSQLGQRPAVSEIQ